MSEHATDIFEPSVPADPKSLHAESSARSRSRRVLDALPTILVLVLLAGIGVWGHHTNWTMPSFAELTGQTKSAKDDWCAEHAVPESLCVLCNRDRLLESCAANSTTWCQEHGVHVCPLCHPEWAQTKSLPSVSEQDRKRVDQLLALRPRPENSPNCPHHGRPIQFASQEAVAKAGIEVDEVRLMPMVESVLANGEIGYNENRLVHVSSRASGAVWRAEKQVGDKVSQGEILALIDAAEVGRAKAELLQAFAQYDVRSRILEQQRAARGAIPERTLQETEALVREARARLLSAQQALANLGLPIHLGEFLDSVSTPRGARSEEKLLSQLRFLGIPAALQSQLDPKNATSNLLPVRSPLDGVIVSRHVVTGEVVDTKHVLFEVADTRTMWLNLAVRLEDADWVQLGQKVAFHTDAGGQRAEGTISWISTAADEKTRTIKVRAELQNTDGKLKAQTFGIARIILREEKNAVVVPNSALHSDGNCTVVFVRDKNYFEEGYPKLFHVRSVRTGAKTRKLGNKFYDGEYTEIIAGVLPGEIVATKGSGVLRSELLKNKIGDG
ncbi:MAG: hypothetical protein KatS3mg105_0752 [Gemmatales bacterium]|nr:MAG: hypothetical protein KatS3mg105_0752 [Gemmatales bacterium]